MTHRYKPATPPCKICLSDEHGYNTCPKPLEKSSTLPKEGEDEAAYHKRLRYNEYMRLWTQRKEAADPTYHRKVIERQNERAKADPNSPERVRARRAMDRRRHWLDDQKRSPCMDCKGTFPVECMQFDHRPGVEKLFNIGESMLRSEALLTAEIDKCDLICANCHAIRTTFRLRERRKSRDAAYLKHNTKHARMADVTPHFLEKSDDEA